MFHSSLRFMDQIARNGSIRKAAERLHISASAVNRQLLQLEEQLGVSLFDRLPRGMRLTAAGEILLGHVRRWDSETAAIRLQLQSLTGDAGGVIRIAAPELTTEVLLPDAMSALHAMFPRVEFSVLTSDTPGIVNALMAKEADVGLSFNARPGPRLRIVATVQPTLGAVMAPDHPLAQSQSVTLLECLAYPLILPSKDWIDQTVAHSMFPGGLGGVQVVARGGRASVLRSFARAGLGITFLTQLEIESDLRSKQLVHVPLDERRLKGATLSLLVPAAQSSAGVTAVFIQMLHDRLRQTHAALV